MPDLTIPTRPQQTLQLLGDVVEAWQRPSEVDRRSIVSALPALGELLIDAAHRPVPNPAGHAIRITAEWRRVLEVSNVLDTPVWPRLQYALDALERQVQPGEAELPDAAPEVVPDVLTLGVALVDRLAHDLDTIGLLTPPPSDEDRAADPDDARRLDLERTRRHRQLAQQAIASIIAELLP